MNRAQYTNVEKHVLLDSSLCRLGFIYSIALHFCKSRNCAFKNLITPVLSRLRLASIMLWQEVFFSFVTVFLTFSDILAFLFSHYLRQMFLVACFG